jgi:hypothetical protein
MAKRWVRAGALVVAVGVLLSGCSYPAEFAIRLNADRTVDYLECWGGMEYVSVDYLRSYQSEPEVVEWEARTVPTPVDDFSHVASPIEIAYYGHTPPNWEGAPALPPPVGWDFVDVSTSWGPIAREDLTVGEWQWHLNSTWPWIPEHPCDGWDIDQDGEPVKVS